MNPYTELLEVMEDGDSFAKFAVAVLLFLVLIGVTMVAIFFVVAALVIWSPWLALAVAIPALAVAYRWVTS